MKHQTGIYSEPRGRLGDLHTVQARGKAGAQTYLAAKPTSTRPQTLSQKSAHSRFQLVRAAVHELDGAPFYQKLDISRGKLRKYAQAYQILRDSIRADGFFIQPSAQPAVAAPPPTSSNIIYSAPLNRIYIAVAQGSPAILLPPVYVAACAVSLNPASPDYGLFFCRQLSPVAGSGAAYIYQVPPGNPVIVFYFLFSTNKLSRLRTPIRSRTCSRPP
jgi:hypothetical protein